MIDSADIPKPSQKEIPQGIGEIDKVVGVKQEGFQNTQWLEDAIKKLEQLKPKQIAEFSLPADIDYRFFIAQLGRPSRTFEFGGLYNPKTRSTKIIRGYAAMEQGGFSPPATNFLRPRLNEDGKTTDDIFFHTHPWHEKNMISYYNIPVNSCKPSDSDTNNAMALRMIEEEDGFERTVISIIGSRGYVSITESSGIHLDDAVLKDSGISDNQLLEIKRFLALEPPVWTENFAKDPQSESQLLTLVQDFYREKQTDRTVLHAEKLRKLKEAVAPFVNADNLDGLISSLAGELPKYPGKQYLRNLGLEATQIERVQSMTGVRRSIYQVEENMGIKEVT